MKLSTGTLLLPSEYLIRNGKPLTGIILEIKDDLWGPNHRVLLSNGIIHWMDSDKINSLFRVDEGSENPSFRGVG